MTTLDGTGLHSGAPCRVSFSREDGPVVFEAEGRRVRLADLVVRRSDFGVEVELGPDGPRVDGVEHLAAALGGLSIRTGIRIRVEGGEVPLLDGAAATFCRALRSLGASATPPRLVVSRAGEVRVGESLYEFLPGSAATVEVEIAFAAPKIGVQRARWDGTAESFEQEIAWARTFGFARDGAALLSAGRARGANGEAVMIMGDDGTVLPPGAPAAPAEHARHKLLDLVGDATLSGGPPRGTLRALRPGHRATREALSLARDRGLLLVT